MSSNNITCDSTYLGFNIGESMSCSRFYSTILSSIQKILDYMINHHCKTYFMRFDLHFPYEYTGDNYNDAVSYFCNIYSRNRSRKGYDPQYLWVREHTTIARHPHYHFIYLFNGSKTNSIANNFEVAVQCWSCALGGVPANGLIELCGERPEFGVMINRNDSQFQYTYGKCFNWASYLAKEDTKDLTPPNVHKFGVSVAC